MKSGIVREDEKLRRAQRLDWGDTNSVRGDRTSKEELEEEERM